jgi:hypothetical protein
LKRTLVPGDQKIRVALFEQKRKLKKIVFAKKRRYKKNIMNELATKKHEGNQKDFWKILKKISSKKKSDPIHPSSFQFVEHFKETFNSKRSQEIPPESKEKGPLDYTISVNELEGASRKLKPRKACGIDNICNEMIISLVDTHPNIVLKLFNEILQSGEVVPEWVMGLIVPIYKKGSKLDPSNYRGITLMSCLGKLFLSILNARLLLFTQNQNILAENQLGFVPGNRTSDAHIIINNLVKKICHNSNSKIYGCFVDFKKAFDSVPRDILLKKLANYGIKGKFFNIVRNIYTSDKSCIKLNNSRSNSFDLNLGVRQGCILSPLLFNIFLCDLCKKLQTLEGKLVLDSTSVNSLVWADDLVLLSESEKGLKEMLKILEEYCDENKLEINTDKTKCMIFNKTGRLLRRHFDLKGVQLENVRTYKYLGFLITPSGEIASGLKDLRDRALKAFMMLKQDLGTAFNQDVLTTLSLVDALIKPILLYVSDFWGCMKPPKSNPIENLHMMMCKQILGVQKQTTNIGVLLELGRIPMHIYAAKFAVKNWERIKRGQANSVLLASYRDAIEENLPWILDIKSTLEQNAMLNFYLKDYTNKLPFIHKKVFQRLSDIFHQNSFEVIKSETSKLRTYATFKKEIGFEKYLSAIKNPQIRIQVSKFRLSNHRLMIEVGRHNGIPKEIRFCPFCPQKVENEFHFLLECSLYKIQRENLINPITNLIPGFIYLTEGIKLAYLLTDIEPNVCTYIANSFDIRSFLISKPKRRN